MLYIHLVSALFILLAVFAYRTYFATFQNPIKPKDFEQKRTIFLFLGVSLLIRLWIATVYAGHNSDFSCFFSWANISYTEGFSTFYTLDAFTDYPPGYIYILAVIGAINSIFKISYLSQASIILIKLPAILCDLATAYLIYRIARKNLTFKIALGLSALYVYNPAIVLNSTIWAQVDSVFTVAVLLMTYYITHKKYPHAIISYVLGVLIKPQTLIFTPILLFVAFEEIFLHKQAEKWQFTIDLKKLRFFSLWASAGIALFILLCLPFGLQNVIDQYILTLTSYNRASVNAYNLWTFFGLNWHLQTETFLGIRYATWGYVFIILTVISSAGIYFCNAKNPAKVFLTAANTIIGMFLFSVRMHERYLFPALILLLFAYIYFPHKKLLLCYTLFSVVHFYNTAHVLFFYNATEFNWHDKPSRIIAFATLLVFAYYANLLIQLCQNKIRLEEKPLTNKQQNTSTQTNQHLIQMSEKASKITLKDLSAIFVITILYASLAFYDLGYRFAPQTEYQMEQEQAVTFTFEQKENIAHLSFYLGHYEQRSFSIYYKEESTEDWKPLLLDKNSNYVMDSVLKWDSFPLNIHAKTIKLVSHSNTAVVRELVFLNDEGTQIIPANYTEYKNLFDEQVLYDQQASFRSGTYFDEIYHVRTAYEYLQQLPPYENTHPPLGKILIMTGMKLFGVNPFGWRFMGTFFGILMLPVMFLFAKKILQSTFLATITTLLFAVDFMHFAQTRLATIDSFVTFFILAMYYCLYLYTTISFYDTKLSKTLIPLAACGVFLGLASAVKLTGVYAGLGIALLLGIQFYTRYKEFKVAQKNPQGTSKGLAHQYIINCFFPKLKLTLLACVGFFIIIPTIIYTLSYLPVLGTENQNIVQKMLESQRVMFSYHTQITATHPFSSHWYEWPLITKPLWLYSNVLSPTHAEGISSFGNPLLWWIGIPVFFYLCYLAIKKNDRVSIFLLFSYLAQYLPWIAISRITFIYHYFPCVPFVVLMIGYTMQKLPQRKKITKPLIIAYTTLCLITFAGFYPVLAGQPIAKLYVNTYLRWLPSWTLLVR